MEVAARHPTVSQKRAVAEGVDPPLATAATLSPDPLLLLDETGHFAYGNSAWYALAEAAGGATRSPATVFPPGTLECLTEAGGGGARDLANVEIAGRTFTLCGRGTSDTGHVFVFFRETTQARLLRECFLQPDRFSELSRIVSGVGHEINNPAAFIHANLSALTRYLRSLTTYLSDVEDLVQDLAPADPDRAAEVRASRQGLKIGLILEDTPSLLADCLQGIERIRRVIADLRSFTQPGVAVEEHFDLHEMLDHALTLSHPVIGARIRVQRSYSGQVVLTGIARRLTQVFVNLIGNSAQAIADRGTIHLKTSATPREVQVVIADDGCGIPDAIRENLFEPFVTTKGNTSGAGLGLFVCRNVVRQHGGDIEITSEPGRGTTVNVRLPRPEAGGES